MKAYYKLDDFGSFFNLQYSDYQEIAELNNRYNIFIKSIFQHTNFQYFINGKYYNDLEEMAEEILYNAIPYDKSNDYSKINENIRVTFDIFKNTNDNKLIIKQIEDIFNEKMNLIYNSYLFEYQEIVNIKKLEDKLKR